MVGWGYWKLCGRGNRIYGTIAPDRGIARKYRIDIALKVRAQRSAFSRRDSRAGKPAPGSLSFSPSSESALFFRNFQFYELEISFLENIYCSAIRPKARLEATGLFQFQSWKTTGKGTLLQNAKSAPGRNRQDAFSFPLLNSPLISLQVGCINANWKWKKTPKKFCRFPAQKKRGITKIRYFPAQVV